MTAKPTIAFVGMTHLGLVSASACAGKGFATICLDQDAALIERLRAGKLPVVEPDLDTLVRDNGGRQRFTADAAALGAANVIFIAPDVPTDDHGQSDLAGITTIINQVVPHLNPAAILVVMCQVPPGFTRGVSFPKSRLYYQVETLIFGRAVERASKPERYIVGCEDPAQSLPDAYSAFLAAHGCPILPMRYESAELAKISINMCLVASISVANTIAEVCEVVGADWSEIVPALKLDRRIGPGAYLAPGLGIAGGNLERDLATVIRIGKERGIDTGVVAAWIANSQHRRDWAAREVERLGLADKRLAVWGLAYKEDTHSTKNSPSLATLAQLSRARLVVHDPVISASAVGRSDIETAADPLAILAGADALLILTPWQVYRQADPNAIAKRLSGKVVLDPYRVLDPAACRSAGLRWLGLGAPRNEA